jgi:hypothetical protein
VVFTVKVSASGQSAPRGTIAVRGTDGKNLKATVSKSAKGRVTLTLNKQAPGRHSYTFMFTGTGNLANTTYSRFATVK